MTNQPRRRITKEQAQAVIAVLSKLVELVPARYRPVAAALVVLLGAISGAVWYETAPEPGYAATAILADGRDVNVVVRDGVGIVHDIGYDQAGHGLMLRTTSDWTTHSIGVAPVLGWSLPYIDEIAQGRRGLRYCPDAGIADHPETLAQSIRAVQFVFDTLPGVQPSVQDCGRYDLQFGVTPEADCGSPQAIGCAAHRGSFVRVTVSPSLPLEGQFWTMVHEALHALNLGHTGQYGGEGRGHGHVSCLGFLDIGVGGNNRPVDNPNGLPCTPDIEDGAGGFRWGFRARATATATASPTATVPPPVALAPVQFWLHRPDGATDCAIGGDGAWLVVTCGAGEPARFWWRFLPDGNFQEVRR